jgi:hypothetical protein
MRSLPSSSKDLPCTLVKRCTQTCMHMYMCTCAYASYTYSRALYVLPPALSPPSFIVTVIHKKQIRTRARENLGATVACV